MADKTLKEFQKEAVATFKKYEQTGTLPWDYSIAARDLPHQVGSLTKALLQIEGLRHKKGQSEEALKAVVADELADIFAEILFIADGLNISLEQAWDGMLRSDDKKIAERKVK